MTFADLVGVVCDYCNLSSQEAVDRVGRSVNRHYKRVTASLGLDAVRYVTIVQTTTAGVRFVTFSGIEHVHRVIDATDSTAIRLLTEVSFDHQRSLQPGTGEPLTWALRNTDADSVTILLDTLPQTTYSLQADGTSTLATLAGNDEPVFPESYHDILSWYVISEELLRKEKRDLSEDYKLRADTLLSELRHYLADSPSRDTQQAAFGTTTGSPAASGGGGSIGGTAYTQSALLSFEQNTLRLMDTDETHGVTVNIGSNLTAERALSLVTGDADRTVTLSGNPTLSDWFDQSVKSTASPTFAAPIASTAVIVGAATTSGIRLDLESGTLAVREGDDSAYGPAIALSVEATTSAVVGTTATVGTAVIVGAATTSGIRLDLETGTLAVREGDDSAYGPVKALTVESTTTATVGTTLTAGTAVIVGTADTSGIRLDLETGTLAVREGDDTAYGPVKALTLESTTTATVGTTLTVTGGQIVFPASQSASAGANTLDDYEEGSWTPVIGGSGGTSGQTYAANGQVGRYVKIGKLVTAQFYAALSTEGTITDNVQIQGLPFTADNETNLFSVGAVIWTGLATNWVSVVTVVLANTTTAAVRGTTAAATSNNNDLTAADIGNSTALIGTVTYRASA